MSNFFNPNMSLDEVEKLHIQSMMDWWKGNKTQAARSLQIAIRTLDAKLEKYAQDQKRADEFNTQQRIRDRETLARLRGEVPPAPAAPVRETRPPVNGHATAGVRVEPVIETPAQQIMPVPERQEVQSVLSNEHAKSSKRGRS